MPIVSPAALKEARDMSLYSQNGDSNTVRSTIESLEKQRNSFKIERDKDATADSTELDVKIKSIEKRIENLKARLDKMKQKENDSENGECETCKNRRYQDGSDDPGVSFKMATKMSPGVAASAVRGHEMEHVVRNQVKAAQNDMKIVSQSVVIKNAVCPECGRSYVAGGTTRTSMKPKDSAERYNVGIESDVQSGRKMNSVA